MEITYHIERLLRPLTEIASPKEKDPVWRGEGKYIKPHTGRRLAQAVWWVDIKINVSTTHQ